VEKGGRAGGALPFEARPVPKGRFFLASRRERTRDLRFKHGRVASGLRDERNQTGGLQDDKPPSEDCSGSRRRGGDHRALLNLLRTAPEEGELRWFARAR
jgi:hypothetical protein